MRAEGNNSSGKSYVNPYADPSRWRGNGTPRPLTSEQATSQLGFPDSERPPLPTAGRLPCSYSDTKMLSAPKLSPAPPAVPGVSTTLTQALLRLEDAVKTQQHAVRFASDNDCLLTHGAEHDEHDASATGPCAVHRYAQQRLALARARRLMVELTASALSGSDPPEQRMRTPATMAFVLSCLVDGQMHASLGEEARSLAAIARAQVAALKTAALLPQRTIDVDALGALATALEKVEILPESAPAHGQTFVPPTYENREPRGLDCFDPKNV